VDARRYSQTLHALPVIRDQVARADLIVLNHCDEVGAAAIDEAQVRLRQVNPGAPVVVAAHADIAFDALLTEARSDAPPATAVEHGSGHDQRWHAYEVVLPDELDATRLLALVDRLPETVERVKGFVTHGNDVHVLQKVGPFPARLEAWPAGPQGVARGRLVVVARQPVGDELRRLFPGCEVVVAASRLTAD
jgi:G3E family GTPase